jgi:hypothetical protein
VSADGEVVVGFELPAYGVPPTRFVLRPGLRTGCDVVLMIDGMPHRATAIIEVVGSVCPDPSDHLRECDENDHDTYGDCDGDVREYVVWSPVADKRAGDVVLLCASHAQQHGRHIRRRVIR